MTQFYIGGWVFYSWGLGISQKPRSIFFKEYISIQDVIIVLIFYDLLNLLLSEDSCKEREFETER